MNLGLPRNKRNRTYDVRFRYLGGTSRPYVDKEGGGGVWICGSFLFPSFLRFLLPSDTQGSTYITNLARSGTRFDKHRQRVN